VAARLRVPAGGSYADLLALVRREVAATSSRQEVPWPLVARRAGIGAAEIWLNVAPPPSRTRFRGLTLDPGALGHDYPIRLPAEAWRGEMLLANVVDAGPGADVAGWIDHNTEQLTGDTVAELAGDVLDVLTAAAADPAAPLPPFGSRPPLTPPAAAPGTAGRRGGAIEPDRDGYQPAGTSRPGPRRQE
jgi:hypothetical protein